MESLDHAVSEVRDPRGRFDHPRARDVAGRACEMAFEQPHAVAEQYGHDVDLKLVEESGLQVLLRHVRAAAHRHVLAGRGLHGLLECSLDPSMTKVKVVPPCFVTGSRAWWVSTNTGW
jgi:hypothetical protein